MISEILDIATRINPLNMFYKDKIQQILKPYIMNNAKKDEIKMLTYNIQMIPKVVSMAQDHYPSQSQDERCLDIIKCFDSYDVVSIQESFGGLYSECREKLIQYATKAGFFYIECDDEPSFGSTYVSDGGLMIISRFPIIERSYSPFSWS